MKKITTKGQETIPKRLRDHLASNPGHRSSSSLRQTDGFFCRRSNGREQANFARLRGSAKPGMATDEVMALTRGEDDG